MAFGPRLLISAVLIAGALATLPGSAIAQCAA